MPFSTLSRSIYLSSQENSSKNPKSPTVNCVKLKGKELIADEINGTAFAHSQSPSSAPSSFSFSSTSTSSSSATVVTVSVNRY